MQDLDHQQYFWGAFGGDQRRTLANIAATRPATCSKPSEFRRVEGLGFRV